MLKDSLRTPQALLQAAKPNPKTPKPEGQLAGQSAHLDMPHLSHEKPKPVKLKLAKPKSDAPDVKRRSANAKHASNKPAKKKSNAEKKSGKYVAPHAKNAKPARNKPPAKPPQPKKRKPWSVANAVASAKKKWPPKPNAAVPVLTNPQSTDTATHRKTSPTDVVVPVLQTTRRADGDRRLCLRQSRRGRR
jgi:hypothetical protein